MKLGKRVWFTIGLVALALICGVGWLVTSISSRHQTQINNDLATLQATFTQEYGGKATIKQLVAPEKVYVALWDDESGNTHVSWYMGGVWAVVKNLPPGGK